MYVRRLENMSSAFGADSYPTHLDEVVKSTKHLCYHLGVLPYWKKLMQQCFLFSWLPLLLLRTACSSAPGPEPTILSALYGYDGCIGGVNNFATEEEYLRELKRFVFVTP